MHREKSLDLTSGTSTHPLQVLEGKQANMATFPESDVLTDSFSS